MSMTTTAPSRREAQGAAVKPRVLVVEDETALVELLRYNLEQAGFRVSVAYDGEEAPGYTMGTFTSSTVPGCRAPHVWLEGRRSLYDALGPNYTLLRLDPTAQVGGILAAAAMGTTADRRRSRTMLPL